MNAMSRGLPFEFSLVSLNAVRRRFGILRLSVFGSALRDDFMRLLLDECRAGGCTLVFVSHDDRLALHFDERLSLPTLNRAAS